MKKVASSILRWMPLLCGILLLLSGCADKQHIASFDNDLTAMLHDQYELTIPENAVFHSGYYDNAFQDNGIYLSFSVPAAQFDALFSDRWDITDAPCGDQVLEDLLDKPVDRMYVYSQEMYTYLIGSSSENGMITCAFHGRHPQRNR